MSNTSAAEAFNITVQIIPFVMITALFIVISYLYGHTLEPCSLISDNWDHSFFTV